MSETLSVRLNWRIKRRLENVAARSKRSQSTVAAEAIVAYLDAEDWQLAEIRHGIDDLERGRVVSHERVSKWLRSWGNPSPRHE